jgi:DNA (cytosine-5)-methyltransferase 1
MRFVSLFAGVGGFDLGFEKAGMQCVGQVEIDKHARRVLETHWPDVRRHDDVTTAREWATDAELIGGVDLVCGGFPCQDVSVAGKRAGLAGQRTGLFWDALAFATHVQARWIVLENVPGLLSSNEGRDFGVVITAMADAGYGHIEWRVLDSQFHGVPQRRRRVFIVASSRALSGRAVFVEREGLRGDLAPRHEARKDAARAITSSAAAGSSGLAPLSLSLSLSRMQAFGKYTNDGTAGTVKARDYKDATDLVVAT